MWKYERKENRGQMYAGRIPVRLRDDCWAEIELQDEQGRVERKAISSTGDP